MKISPGQIAAIGGVGIVGFLVFRTVRAGATIIEAVNPASDENIVNRGFNELTGATDRGSSVGSDLFDFVQRLRGIEPFDPNAPIPEGATADVRNQKPRPNFEADTTTILPLPIGVTDPFQGVA